MVRPPSLTRLWSRQGRCQGLQACSAQAGSATPRVQCCDLKRCRRKHDKVHDPDCCWQMARHRHAAPLCCQPVGSDGGGLPPLHCQVQHWLNLANSRCMSQSASLLVNRVQHQAIVPTHRVMLIFLRSSRHTWSLGSCCMQITRNIL